MAIQAGTCGIAALTFDPQACFASQKIKQKFVSNAAAGAQDVNLKVPP
jgi:hypothetical protein